MAYPWISASLNPPRKSSFWNRWWWIPRCTTGQVKRRDCRMLLPKWDISVTHPPPEAQELLWKKGCKVLRVRSGIWQGNSLLRTRRGSCMHELAYGWDNLYKITAWKREQNKVPTLAKKKSIASRRACFLRLWSLGEGPPSSDYHTSKSP